MAIDIQRPTDRDGFVRRQKKFFPQKLHLGHDQLKHFINCPHTGQVYLVNQRQIFCIDTQKNKRTLVADLPFDARCTATGFGWLCVGGGDNGYFASVRIPHGLQDPHRNIRDTLGPGETPHGPRDYWDRFERTLPPRIKIERLGDQLINSISIHRLVRADGQAEVVALVTNNDHSVRIWSLTNEIEVDFETFPFPMNHATISPDGKLLVVVGDQEWAYLYRRHDRLASPSSPNSALHWERLRHLTLHKPPGVKTSEYFTTAWSPNGRLLATASQQGYITVFDVDSLVDLTSDRDPVVAVVPSSRAAAYCGPGAVRTMCFAPDPWDLLLWTENNGRLGVGDLRTGLMTRQIVDLDPKGIDVQRVELADASSLAQDPEMLDLDNYDAFQTYLGGRRHAPGADGGAQSALVRDYTAALSQQRRQGLISASPAVGLTDEEWQRLDMLRTTRQHEESIRRAVEGDTSNIRTMPLPQSIRHDPSVPAINRPRAAAASTTARADEFLDSIRSFARDHPDSVNAVHAAERLRQAPRRRRSVLLSPAAAAAAGATTEDTDSDPWRTIEAAIRRAGAESSAAAHPQGVADDDDNDDEEMPELVPGPPALVSSAPFASVILPAPEPFAQSSALRPPQPTSQPGPADLPRPWERNTGNIVPPSSADYYMELLSAERAERHNVQRGQQAPHRAPAADDPAHSTARLAAVQRARDRRQRELGTYAGAASTSTAQLSRQIGLRLSGAFGPEPSLRLVVGANDLPWLTSSLSSNPDDGLETTGVAWDEARRVVYAGTVEGVFELAMDFESRKFWPSVQMR